MKILSVIEEKWDKLDYPFLIKDNTSLYFKDFLELPPPDLSEVSAGDIVLLIGEFKALSILTFFKLIEIGAIIAPVIEESKENINEKINIINADFVIKENEIQRIISVKKKHDLIFFLRKKEHPGLIFFSTGTTGYPKAILHDVTLLFERFKTPRQAYKTINFLMFDHMGGINTMLHALYNCGTVVAPENRNVQHIIDLCNKYEVELLPTTPTFLRMLLMSGSIPNKIPKTLKVITYGTELMDQTTLDSITQLLPNVIFKQTYGLSEFCVLRVKNRESNDLFIKIGGEGVETKIRDRKLLIRSSNRMLGYLNAQQPFDNEGWYDTKDLVEEDAEYVKIIGRETDVVNVGGLKFMKSEVEEIALRHEKILQVKVMNKNNSITGQHIEIIVQPILDQKIEKSDLKKYFSDNLPTHMRPLKIMIGNVEVSHRMKKK